MDRLLVLGCAQRKRPDCTPLPALQRYDGPAYRVVRRYLAERDDSALDIYILSAEFGWIAADVPIADYDRQMTPQRARELAPAVEASLAALGDGYPAGPALSDSLCAVLGKDYLAVLMLCRAPLAQALVEHNASGAIGVKQAKLKRWLRSDGQGTDPIRNPISSIAVEEERRLRLRGREFVLSRAAVERLGTAALARSPSPRAACAAWCVDLGGHPVAPKWLVAVATGLPVGAFTTGDARRVLAHLGIGVRRT